MPAGIYSWYLKYILELSFSLAFFEKLSFPHFRPLKALHPLIPAGSAVRRLVRHPGAPAGAPLSKFTAKLSLLPSRVTATLEEL